MTNEQICKINELLSNIFAGKQLQRLSFNQLHNDSEWVDWKELSISEHMNIDHYRIKPDLKPLTREEITAQWVRDNDVKVGDHVRVMVDGAFLLKGSTYKITDIKGYCIACEGYAEEREFNVEDIEKVTRKIEKFSFEDRELFRDKWIKSVGSYRAEQKVFSISDKGITLLTSGFIFKNFTWDDALKEIEFIDGKPFGKEVWS